MILLIEALADVKSIFALLSQKVTKAKSKLVQKGELLIEKRTISGRISKKHSLPHNNREFLCENVDPIRTKDNITIIKDDIGQVYHELFDKALTEYNAKQKRKDRIIKDYHEHIRHSRQEQEYHEAIFQIGNQDDTSCGSDIGKVATELIREFADGFQSRNPHLRVFNAVIHLDEATPHIHIDFITFPLQTYTIYNREYPWSPSCQSITNDTWINYSIGTGEYKEIPVNSDSFDDSILKQLLAIYSTDGKGDIEERTVEKDMRKAINKRTQSKEIVKDIGCILASTVELLWEEEYDGSKESAISICHPCPKFIEDMKLTQKQDDGAYYDTSDRIAAFDTSLTQGLTGVMVRKDILDQFLAMNKLRLVWFVNAEKAVHADGYMISMLSRWEGMLLYNNGSIEGDICKA